VNNHHSGAPSGGESSATMLTQVVDRGLGTFPTGHEGHGDRVGSVVD
jgi:hypothetical protein